jgi:hypothetical protein
VSELDRYFAADVVDAIEALVEEPVAHALLVLAQQRTAQLGEPVGRIIEHSQDRLAILDREGNENLVGVEREKEDIGAVLEPGPQQELSQDGNVPFGDRHTGEPHAGDATRLSGRSNGSGVAVSPLSLAIRLIDRIGRLDWNRVFSFGDLLRCARLILLFGSPVSSATSSAGNARVSSSGSVMHGLLHVGR